MLVLFRFGKGPFSFHFCCIGCGRLLSSTFPFPTVMMSFLDFLHTLSVEEHKQAQALQAIDATDVIVIEE
jgi:hypothetical protein